MAEPGIWADALNKFSQLTPWVQAVICLTFGGMVLGVANLFKETVRVLVLRRSGDKAAE